MDFIYISTYTCVYKVQVHVKKLILLTSLVHFKMIAGLRKMCGMSSVNKKLLDSITLTLNVLTGASKAIGNIRNLKNWFISRRPWFYDQIFLWQSNSWHFCKENAKHPHVVNCMKCQKLRSVSIWAHPVPEFILGKTSVVSLEERKIECIKILGLFGLVVFYAASNFKEPTCPQRYWFILKGWITVMFDFVGLFKLETQTIKQQ